MRFTLPPRLNKTSVPSWGVERKETPFRAALDAADGRLEGLAEGSPHVENDEDLGGRTVARRPRPVRSTMLPQEENGLGKESQ